MNGARWAARLHDDGCHWFHVIGEDWHLRLRARLTVVSIHCDLVFHVFCRCQCAVWDWHSDR